MSVGNAPVALTASERLAKLRQVADLLAHAQQAMTAIGNPPGCDFRAVILDAHAQTIGAVDQWMSFEKERLS